VVDEHSEVDSEEDSLAGVATDDVADRSQQPQDWGATSTMGAWLDKDADGVRVFNHHLAVAFAAGPGSHVGLRARAAGWWRGPEAHAAHRSRLPLPSPRACSAAPSVGLSLERACTSAGARD
jgi:hypothetical protein